MHKKKVLLSTLILLLTLPLTVFLSLDETGVFDSRSRAQGTLLEEFHPADLVGNNNVGIEDFEVWLEDYRAYKAGSKNYTPRSDLNASGDINLSDFSTWLEKWRDYRRYRANPEAYMENVPGGLVAHWALDEHSGSGAFLSDEASRKYSAEPEGTEVYSTGVFGAARSLEEGDAIKVQNGGELPIGERDSVTSFWVNLLDSSFFELTPDSNLLVWDKSSETFILMPIAKLPFDSEEFLSKFAEIDIEGNLQDGSKGWFHLMVLFNSDEDIVEYFINGNSVISYDHSEVQDVSMLVPIAQDGDVAVDNLQVWDTTYTKKVYENSTYNPLGDEDSVISDTEVESGPPEVDVEPYFTTTYPSTTDQEQSTTRDPNDSYKILGYEGRDCVICSSNYEAAVAHFNIQGYTGTSSPSKEICQLAERGTRGYSVEPNSLYYTCASRYVHCGYLSPDFEITTYPVGDDPDVGLNTRAEYLECVDYIIFNQDPDNRGVSPNNLPRTSCVECSTKYSYVVALWNGTCEEATDQERMSVDPDFRYRCSRCGITDGWVDENHTQNILKLCLGGGMPNEYDEVFAKYYVNYDPNRMSAYTSYMTNCVDQREGCPEIVFPPADDGCQRCSNTYAYAHAKWDNPGADGKCYTDDDLYAYATYTCDCSCTASGSISVPVGQWGDSSSGRASHSECVEYCKNQ